MKFTTGEKIFITAIGLIVVPAFIIVASVLWGTVFALFSLV